MKEYKAYDTLNNKEREIVDKLRKSPDPSIANLFELPFIIEDMLNTNWEQRYRDTEKDISEKLLGALKGETV